MTRLQDRIHLEPGNLVANRYEICDRVAKGGMGTVYRVVDRELDNEVVALKLLHLHLVEDDQVFKRFRNEVLVARSLSHPNIIRTFDIGRDLESLRPYILMEFIDGLSLKEQIAANEVRSFPQPMEFDEFLSFYWQILSGVSYAHSKGVIHRDLKPANVLVTSDGEVKLADFGTARIVRIDTSITKTGQVLGTPDYMSPEQIRGESLDKRCDIYALGIMAYELLHAKKPFVSDSPVSVAFKHLNEPLPDFGLSVPVWFKEMTIKACEKDKSDRFDTVAEMLEHIVECSPEFAQKTGVFSVDNSTLLASTVGSSGLWKKKKAETSITNFKDSLISEEEFLLGEQVARVERESGSWTLDYSSSSLRKSAENELSKKKSKWPLLVFSLFLISFVGVNLFYTNLFQFEYPFEEKGLTSKVFENQSGRVVDMPKERLSRKNIARQKESLAEERESLAEELLQRDKDLASFKEKKIVKQLSGRIVREDTSSVVVSRAQALIENIASENVKPKKIKPNKLIPLSGSLLLNLNGSLFSGRSISLEKISSHTWQADVRGLGKGGAYVLRAKEKFSLNVFDVEKKKIIARLKPNSVRLAKNANVKTQVNGRFKALDQIQPTSSPHRFDLIFNGEVLASRLVDFELAKITLSKKAKLGNKPEVFVGKRFENKAPVPILPSIVGNPKRPVAETNKNSIQIVSKELPVAKGFAVENKIRDEVKVEQAERSNVVVSNDVTSKRYSGFLKYSESGEEKKLVLNLLVERSRIRGEAIVSGFNNFSVSGRTLPRGMQLYLRNSEEKINLISGRKENILRGRFNALKSGAQGRWEANFSQ